MFGEYLGSNKSCPSK